MAVTLPAMASASRQLRSNWPFEENGGRYPEAVAYVTRTTLGTAFVTTDGAVVHSLRGVGGHVVERLVGGAAQPSGAMPSAARITVFRDHEPGPGRPLQAFEELRSQPWPGVESVLRLRDGGLERVFELSPGGAIEAVRVRFEGIRELELDRDGGLRLVTASGDLHLSRPLAWQPGPMGLVPVALAYRLDGTSYGFALGAHDPTLPVFIDPLLRSTYAGGSGGDLVQALATDGATVYAAGITFSPNFPGTGVGSGGAQETLGGSTDAFVANYSADLTQLLAATYLGGGGGDEGLAIAVSGGKVYVAGGTTSSDFPGTAGGGVGSSGGVRDGFVARLSGDLATLEQASYFGGSGIDAFFGLAVNGSDVYATGFAQSPNLPGTVGAAQSSLAGNSDAMVARFSTDLTTLIRATYLGGGADETNLGSPAVLAGSLYLTGTTNSHDFPQTAGGLQPSLVVTDLSEAAFVSKLSLDLATIEQSTYYATEFSHDRGDTVAVAGGDVFVLGQTAGADLPGTSGGALPHDNLIDLFVARLDPTLTAVVNATYYGGSNDETAGDLLIAAGAVLVAGSTGSVDLPGTAGGVQPTKVDPFGSTTDTLLARFSLDLATLEGATYLGGSINEDGNALTAIGSTLYLGGRDDSAGFPGTGAGTGGAQEDFGGGQEPDGFVAALSADLGIEVAASVDDVTLAEGDAGTTVFQFTVSLTAPPVAPVTVTVQTADGTAVAGQDYSAVAATVLNFTPAGALTQTVNVQVTGEVVFEVDETFSLELTSSDVLVADGTGVGTIVNDDDLVSVPTLAPSWLVALASLLAVAGALKLRR